MKKITIALSFVFYFLYVESLYAISEENRNFCMFMSDAGQAIMQKRQDGKPISDVMGIVRTQDAGLNNLMFEIIEEAYEVPIEKLVERKKSASIDFGTKIYLDCVKEFK